MRRATAIVTLLVGGLCPRPGLAHDPDSEPQGLDCGAYCLYLMARLEGRAIDVPKLERALPARHPAGSSMLELQRSARALGMRFRGIRFGKNDAPLDRPAIAFLNASGEGHYVVLRPVGFTGTMVQVMNPPLVPRVIDYKNLFNTPSWTGRLLVPETAFEYWAPRLGGGVALVVLLATALVSPFRLPRHLRRGDRRGAYIQAPG